jgi:DNA-binding transcriptional LysR family regulator
MHAINVPDIRAKELLAVIALAEYGSFVAAAAFLKTSQPALTRTLKHVEKALGVTLFARSTRRVEITQAGREFVAVAERVLNDLHITMRNMHDVSSEQRGQVIISTYSAFAYQVLPPILQAYRDRRPQVDIRLREGRQPDILEDVRSGVADFGVGFVDGMANSVTSTTLRREPLCVIVPAGHRLAAGRPDQIRFADACVDSLVSLPVDSFTRRLVDGAAAAAGIHVRHSLVVTRFESVVTYVRANAGVGIVPAGALPVPVPPDIHAAKLVDPSLHVTLGLITLGSRYMTPAAESLMAMIQASVTPTGSGLPAPHRARPVRPRPDTQRRKTS